MKNFKIRELNINHYPADKPDLILIHAFPLSSKMWDSQVEYFRDKFNLFTYDIRGLGQSYTTDYIQTMESYTNDFLSIIDDLNLKNVSVCGLSMGSYIAQRAAIKSPAKFSAVILAASRSERDDDKGILNRSNTIIEIKSGGRETFTNTFIKNLISANSYSKPEIVNFLKGIIDSNSSEGICSAEIALATRTNTLEEYSKLDIPTLILVGSEDILTPINFSEKMHESFKNSILKIIPNAGHLSNIDNPETFNHEVENFLNRVFKI